MSANTARVLRVLFFTYVAITFVHIAYVVFHEPFAFDSWNFAQDTGAKPVSIDRFFEFWHQQYTESNPRIGQPFAYLAYKVVGFAELGTPIAYLAIVLGGFVLGTGRWPDQRNGRDLATLTIGIGFLWFAAPNFASFLFCRAYATNYIWTVAMQVWFLVLLRLHDSRVQAGPAKVIGAGLFGVVIGMCNEHTGPTFLLLTTAYAVWVWRKHGRQSWFVSAAALGTIIGFLLIFFAPGQSERYDEFLKEKLTITQQVLVRGISGNLEIFKGLLFAAAPLLVLLVTMIATGSFTEPRADKDLVEVRARQRRALTVVGLAILGGSLITITVFASPKLGPRFYLHSMVFLLAGVLGVCQAFLHRTRAFAPFVVIAVLASTYAAMKTIPMFTRLDRDSDVRLAQLAATPLDGVYTAESWEQVGESWWFLGDDFRDQKKREFVARYFGLRRVLFRGASAWTTLGIDDVKLTMHYDFDAQICLDEIDEIDIKPYVGRDVGALHHAFLDVITEIKYENPAKLLYIDLVATFLGTQPPMPREKLYVARWDRGVFEGYTAKMHRIGRSTTRQLTLSGELIRSPWEIYVVSIGDAPKLMGLSTSKEPLTYQPWSSRMYWFLACRSDYCFVIYTANHKI